MPPKQKFADGEKVLCFHGPLIYEAKCLKSSVTKEKQVKYFIHYAGWNKNWDEWVPESRVLKYNETNVAKQKEVQKAHSSQPSRAKKAKTRKSETPNLDKSTSKEIKDSDSRASTPTLVEPSITVTSSSSSSTTSLKTPTTIIKPAKSTTPNSEKQDSSSDQPKKKRTKLDMTVESEDQFLNKVEVKLKIPDELKPWLVDDWDSVSRHRKLVKLPVKTNVDTILENYITYKKSFKSTNPHKENATIEITNGIREYFNVMLGTQLLYKFEKPQYAEILKSQPYVPMSQIYGSFHLLRLFVKLGAMLAYTPLDERSIQLLLFNLNEFLKYLVKNSASLFNLQDYIYATPEYHRKVL